ncbi:hypothetical protein BT96DRAFT_925862 [Gymnopus androsaceus JB14]|uniref:Uncharacterized protein n=1 Tax=Gymnopus androsaceus JB14 TaxID=1447944 RepID=A0A6A4GXJ5_9AGAR|nr:hypothetical protein BT96DRAFT_925862 [Gymnopus androsaceus JB14]
MIERLNPIYEEQEEDETFYDLYRVVEEELPSSTSDSSDDENDSEASSQYGPKPRPPPHMIHDPSSFWPLIEEDDTEVNVRFTFPADPSSQSPSNVLDDDNDEEHLEWERRGRSRAVPAKLLRRAEETRKAQIQRFVHESQEIRDEQSGRCKST